MDLTMRIYREFIFDPKATDVSTPIHDVFRHRRGVCQDFAHFAPRLPARAAHPGALCQRLYSDQAGTWLAAAARRGRLARVDFGVGAGSRLG